MAFSRVLYLLIGLGAGLGAALWLHGTQPPSGQTWSASTIIQALVVLATAALAMLATAAGALVTSDWQADVRSRQTWAQLGLTPAELSEPVAAWDINPRYPAPLYNEALRQIFLAHRFALPVAVDHGIADVLTDIRATRIVLATVESSPAQRARDATPKSVRDQENTIGELSEADMADRASRRLIEASSAGVSKVARAHRAAKFRVKRAALRPRLAANSHASFGWVVRDMRIPASNTADIIVLGSSQDDRARPLPDESVGPNSSESTAPPSCRGPPRLVARQARAAGAMSSQRSVERAGAVTAADPTVRDDLGEEIPICAAELDVIETYLGHLLQDLLASPTAKPDSEQT